MFMPAVSVFLHHFQLTVVAHHFWMDEGNRNCCSRKTQEGSGSNKIETKKGYIVSLKEMSSQA